MNKTQKTATKKALQQFQNTGDINQILKDLDTIFCTPDMTPEMAAAVYDWEHHEDEDWVI